MGIAKNGLRFRVCTVLPIALTNGYSVRMDATLEYRVPFVMHLIPTYLGRVLGTYVGSTPNAPCAGKVKST